MTGLNIKFNNPSEVCSIQLVCPNTSMSPQSFGENKYLVGLRKHKKKLKSKFFTQKYTWKNLETKPELHVRLLHLFLSNYAFLKKIINLLVVFSKILSPVKRVVVSNKNKLLFLRYECLPRRPNENKVFWSNHR